MISTTIDFETRSRINLKTAGMYRYAEDPSTDVLCLAVKVGSSPSRIWIPSQFETPNTRSELVSSELEEIIQSSDKIHAHNCGFERVIWHHVMHKRMGFKDLPLEKCYCTASQAAAMSLPRTLSLACAALSLPVQKDREGYFAMLKLCKPQGKDKEFLTDPALFDTLFSYCKTDVDAEHGLAKELPPLSPFERQVWLLDQKINDAGIRVDLAAVDEMIEAVSKVEQDLLEECKVLTGGRVKSARQVKETLKWLGEKGVVGMDNLQKATVAEFLSKEEVVGKPRRLLEIRQQLGKSSVSKYTAMKRMASAADDRVRGTLLYHGATTGRWTARGLQPQNLPQGSLSPEEVEDVFFNLSVLDADGLREHYGSENIMGIASSCIRGCLTASEGSELYCADFSNIEGRVAAWIAGEEWKLQAFRDFDNGEGEDLYKVAYGKAFNKNPSEVTKPERQIGKTMELACGFQGGPKAFVGMGKNVGLTVGRDVLDPLIPKTTVGGRLVQTYVDPPEEYRCAHCGDRLTSVIEDQSWSKGFKCDNCLAKHTLIYFDKQGGCVEWGALRLDDTAEVVDPAFSHRTPKEQEDALLELWAKPLVAAWREAHPQIKSTWYGMEAAAIQTVETGEVREFAGVKFGIKGRFLMCRLPSGRMISYCDPEIKEVTAPWGDKKACVTYMGTCSLSGKWRRQKTYGGSLFQSVVQGTARDVMVEAMMRLDKAGCNLVLTVHDELLSDNRKGNLEAFMEIMSRNPDWAEGLPISVDGWRGYRYKK